MQLGTLKIHGSWKGPCGPKPRFATKNWYQFTIHVRQPSWKQVSQPQTSLQITEGRYSDNLLRDPEIELLPVKSPLDCKEIQPVHPGKEISPEYSFIKDWCWNFNTLANWCKELTHLKSPRCWERLKAEKKGTRQDEMVGWHHWLNRLEFESTLGVGVGQGGRACCSPWSHRESDMTELVWAELNWTDWTEAALQFLTKKLWEIATIYQCLNWCFWTVILEKTLEYHLDCKAIIPVNPKEISPEYSFERLLLKLKLQYFGHLMQRTDSWEKTLMLCKIESRRRRG